MKRAGVLSARERWLEKQRAFWRARAQNFICSHLPWVLAKGGQSGLERLEESLRSMVLGRKLKEQLSGSMC